MLGFIKSLLFKSKSTKKVKKQTPLTEVNFINYYPNLNNVEVFFIGNIWQENTFEQGKSWKTNTNFINDYLNFKEDYIKTKNEKNEPFLINDIVWAYYNKYKLAYVSEYSKMKMWSKDKQVNFMSRTEDMGKFFKWVEKDKYRTLLFENDKEKRNLREELKNINQELKKEKSEVLLNKKKELSLSINKIIEENKSFEIETKKYKELNQIF
jgi:hypothetical protein